MPNYNLLTIDLKEVARNIERIRESLPQKTRIMPMIKASAYGTDPYTLASLYVQKGVDILGVSHVQEAVKLKKKGITQPIFVIHAPAYEAKEIVKYDLEIGVSDSVSIESLAQEAKKRNKIIKVHLHVDTGMKRFGCIPAETLQLAQSIKANPHLYLEGLMTHFVGAEDVEYDTYSLQQIEIFKSVLAELAQQGIKPPWIHAQNSAATFRFSMPFCNMVRVGLAPFGYMPRLLPALSLKSRIVSLHDLKKGESLGYNRAYMAEKEGEKIAICPLGYHDGIHLHFSGKGYALIHGQKAPFVGRICMDFLMLNVTGILGVKIGSEVLFFGKDEQGNYLSLEEFASFAKTNLREVMTNLGPRIKRQFLYEKKIH